MHRYLKLIRTVPTVAGIVLAILSIPIQLSGQNGQAPRSSGDQTQSSVSKAENKNVPCAKSDASTAPVKYATPAPPGQHHVDLNWTASTSPEVKEYKVHRCIPSSPCLPATSVINTVTGTSYSDDKVQPGPYCYFVTPFVQGRLNSDLDRARSNILYVVIPSP